MLGALAVLGLHQGVRSEHDGVPFVMAVVIFLCAFGAVARSFWPYMIPFSVTIADAAAPASSLRFLFYGAGRFVIPVIVVYD
jgi:cytochrome d ubiquinol oxidase subunit II